MLATEIDNAVELLIKETRENGGSTVSLIGTPVPETGYMVGGYTDSLIFDSGLLGHGNAAWQAITKWIDSQFAFATKFSVFLGGWIDTDTDLVYIDLSQHFTDLSDAKAIAHFNNEIAIWDLGEAKEIRI